MNLSFGRPFLRPGPTKTEIHKYFRNLGEIPPGQRRSHYLCSEREPTAVLRSYL